MYKGVRCLLAGFAFLYLSTGHSQPLGLLPPTVKWMQMTDDSLRIIFPEGREETARRIASLMLKFASRDPISKEGRYRPISVLLQPQTNISNAYVGLAPYVSEFYLQPSENPFRLGSLPWEDLLSVHEYRHVQQVNAAITGISHIVKVIFGELAFTGLYNLAIPNWFREGDAVYVETKWTRQGRGRLSHFTLPFRMKLLKGESWDYYTVRNGSYKEFTPDHYPLGYLLVQYGNHLFGENTWDTIVQEAARFKHLLSPFSGAVQSRTGDRNKHLYQHAMEWYREQWVSGKDKDISYPLVNLMKRDMENVFFDMTFPDVAGDGSVYTAITTFDRTPAIYKIVQDGSRKKVMSLGLQQDTYFDYSEQKLVWTELRFDPRWQRRDKNVIVVYDERTSDKLIIEPSKGYYTPALDHRGLRIAALHADDNGAYNLHILDATTGAVIAELPNPGNLFLAYPVWSDDQQKLIATARNAKGEMALVSQDISSGEIRQITHYSYHVIGRPRLHDHWILVTTSLDDLDQVYAVDGDEGIFYQVSMGNLAHYDPVWDPVRDVIICSQYRLDGNKLVVLPANPHEWKMRNLDNGIRPIEGEAADLLAGKIEERNLEVSKYSPWLNALNFHSWTITADDPVWGAEARSNNILNNISLVAGYEYNRNSKAAGPYLDLNFGMWYPVLTLGLRSTSGEFRINGREHRVVNDRVDVGVILPLSFSAGPYHQLVNLSTTFNAGEGRIRPTIESIEDFHFNYMQHSAILINARRRAYRQPVPSWGQRLDAGYAHELTGDQISQFYLSGDLALPAAHPSHYILLRGELLTQDLRMGAIQLGSRYQGARGFDQEIGRMQYRFGATYGFPLLYPDIGIGNIFYTKRIRLQPFYDVAYAVEDEQHPWVRSAGVEAVIDFEFPPVSLGLRYSRLLSGGNGVVQNFEIFIPVEKF